jgi:ribA/ribD-fused uncharacterized protein
MCSPSESKKLGRQIKLRSDWEGIKDNIMYTGVLAKFAQHSDLKQQLLDTHPLILIEGNYHHDNYWGDCYCKKCQKIAGKNSLGKILMYVRDQHKKISNLVKFTAR